MKGGGQVHFDLDELVKVFHELCGELGVSVANDFLRQSVFAPKHDRGRSRRFGRM